MGIGTRRLLGILALATSSLIFSGGAIAQEVDEDADVIVLDSLPEAFEDAFYSNDRNFFENRSLYRQINWILGQGSIVRNGFPENEIARDGAAVHAIYEIGLALQNTSDPLLRTPDLPNPYETSLLLLPSVEFRGQAELENFPSTFGPPPEPQAQPVPQPQRPVPALY